MNCPKCSGTLAVKFYERVEIDKCSSCNGVWLDNGEMPKIMEREIEKFDRELIRETMAKSYAGVPSEEVASEVSCPKCSSDMSPINYNYSSGIIIDRCLDHGIWLDHTELEKLQINREKWKKKAEEESHIWSKMLKDAKDDNQSDDLIDEGTSSSATMNRLISFIVDSL